jgi:hypothetical protein
MVERASKSLERVVEDGFDRSQRFHRALWAPWQVHDQRSTDDADDPA